MCVCVCVCGVVWRGEERGGGEGDVKSGCSHEGGGGVDKVSD